MPTMRLLSPATATPYVAHWGMTYPGAPGTILDINDQQAEFLRAVSWRLLGPVGPTSARPPSSDTLPFWAKPGTFYFDTTLSAWIVFDGAVWRSTTTGAQV